MFIILITVSLVKNALGATVFTANCLLINNSVPKHMLGSVNGLSTMLGATGNAIGPVIGSSLFAWSISSPRPFPFNVYFVYLLDALLSVVLLGLGFVAPKSMTSPVPSPEGEEGSAQEGARAVE